MLGRILMVVLSLPVLAAGSHALLATYMPESPVADALQEILHAAIAVVSADSGLAIELQGWLLWPGVRFVLAPFGVGLLLAGLLPPSVAAGSGQTSPHEAGAAEKPRKSSGVDKRLRKKAEKQAQMLSKKGEVREAAELLLGADHFDKAADYFIEAGEFVRAAEIRHDQNLFLESAELYLRAGQHQSAGAIFAQQDEFGRAAECYHAIGSTSVAAEMYEKHGDLRKAAQCYEEADFLRHAAAAYVGCRAWVPAAECLERVYREESLRDKGDAKLQQDLIKLVLQSAKLYQRAEQFERALEILERGRCFVEAAELALRLEQYAKSAQLFQDAGDPERAAEALRRLGEDEEAARILGNVHRDRGESKTAAEYFEQAGDDLDAADLYRAVEAYSKSGDCFMRQCEFLAAAEMYTLADDGANAAICYEKAEHFKEAAECRARLGQHENEAELLGKAGLFLPAGQIHHREGMDDEAIKVLQQVDPGHPDFAEASALLGDIFQARGQLSLAIKKLKQAIGDRELDRDSLPIYYSLATLCNASGAAAEAVEIFEKILTFDYHYKDVEQRLVEARERLKTLSTETTVPENTGTRPAGADGQPGRYQIVGELGRGGMGIVYKAKDTALDRLVAYKVLPDTLQENPQALKNFLREAKSAAKLNHPNIVTVYDTGAQDGRYYIAMEYVDGTTLKEILRRRGPIAPAGILHVLVQMCEAMSYAHDEKVVHRDIKTSNVMWARDKKAKLMDFGLAKVIEEVRNHTTVVSGTPYYMSPEQTLGTNIDHRTDIYSLGVTLFELAAGTVPFKEGNIPYHHVHTPPPDVRDLQPTLPAALARVINRCLLKDPAQRYQSAREILDEVRSTLGQTETNVGG
ncbi:MAG: protein kinase [Myxococcota bacterium]|nr:protein kinase [Myxococcota bacterium]